MYIEHKHYHYLIRAVSSTYMLNEMSQKSHVAIPPTHPAVVTLQSADNEALIAATEAIKGSSHSRQQNEQDDILEATLWLFTKIGSLPSSCRDELKHLNLPDIFVHQLLDLITMNEAVDDKLVPLLPRYRACEWALEVSVTSSHLNKVLEPVVKLTFETTDGDKITVRMNTEKFSALRYKVAETLKTMCEVERSCEKI